MRFKQLEKSSIIAHVEFSYLVINMLCHRTELTILLPNSCIGLQLAKYHVNCNLRKCVMQIIINLVLYFTAHNLISCAIHRKLFLLSISSELFHEQSRKEPEVDLMCIENWHTSKHNTLAPQFTDMFPHELLLHLMGDKLYNATIKTANKQITVVKTYAFEQCIHSCICICK